MAARAAFRSLGHGFLPPMHFAAMVFPPGKRVKLDCMGKRPTKRRARGETRAGAQTREDFMKRTALVALGRSRSRFRRPHPRRNAPSRSPASAPSPGSSASSVSTARRRLKAAAEAINNAGGVTLGDGSKAKFAIEFLDDRCNAEEGISVVRRIASTDAFVAVGPTCSNVADRCSASCRRRRAMPPTPGCSSRSSPTSPPRADSPRSPNGRSAMCRANSTCTSRCSPGSRRSIRT